MKKSSTGRECNSLLRVGVVLLASPLFLAAVPGELPDPNNFASIGWVIVILSALVWGVNQVMELFGKFKPQPPLASQLDNIRAGLDHKLEALASEGKAGRGRIHEHLNKVQDEYKQTIKTIEAELRDHDRKITALETRVWGIN